MASRLYKPGDLVKHRAFFLRSISWFTNVPKNGKVIAVEDTNDRKIYGPPVIEVEWSDGHTSRILACNVQPCSQPG